MTYNYLMETSFYVSIYAILRQLFNPLGMPMVFSAGGNMDPHMTMLGQESSLRI